LNTDTWSGATATATNGKDPCVALGAGWRSPTAADWQNVKNYEDLEGVMTAFMSNLKLPASGFRDGYGGFVFRNGESFYWSATTWVVMLQVYSLVITRTLQRFRRQSVGRVTVVVA